MWDMTALVPDYCFLIKVKNEKLRVRLIHVVKNLPCCNSWINCLLANTSERSYLL